MERRFDFLDILDYLMLMESIGFFTSDFFGPRPLTHHNKFNKHGGKCSLTSLCFQAWISSSARVQNYILYDIKITISSQKKANFSITAPQNRSLDDKLANYNVAPAFFHAQLSICEMDPIIFPVNYSAWPIIKLR